MWRRTRYDANPREAQQSLAREEQSEDAQSSQSLSKGAQWRIISSNFLGLTFEAYDLTVYSLLVTAVTKHFHVPTWYGFLVLTMTYIGRSLGGLVFGNFGDRFGRRTVLIVTVLGYSLCTALTGLSWDIVSLLVFRGITGIFVGGEYVGYAYTMEAVSKKHRGTFSGLIVASYSVGFILSAAVYGIVTTIAGPHFASGNGWRWPFFVGILPALIALWLRLGVPESRTWTKVRSTARATQPIFQIFTRRYLLRTLRAWILMAALIWGYDVLILAQPTMLTKLGVVSGATSEISIVTNVGSLVAALVGGWLSQRIGRRITLVMISSLCLPAAFVFAPFWYVPTVPSYLYLVVAGFVGAFFAEAGFGVMPAYLSELYPTEIRATGSTGTYNLGQIIAGWSTTILAATFGGSASSFMIGMTINACIAFVVVIIMAALGRDTRDVDLTVYALTHQRVEGG
jgi:MFS family permease